MERIQFSAKFRINAGKYNAFKTLADKCIAIVNEKEKNKGALQYDWFFSEDKTECVVRETYADSNAVLAHMGNVGEPLGEILAISDFALEIYGNMSDELQKAAVGLNPQVYSFYQGL